MNPIIRLTKLPTKLISRRGIGVHLPRLTVPGWAASTREQKFYIELILRNPIFHDGELEVDVTIELWLAYDCKCAQQLGKQFCRLCSARTGGDLLKGGEKQFHLSSRMVGEKVVGDVTKPFHIDKEGKYFIVCRFTDVLARDGGQQEAEVAVEGLAVSK
jgi:hypothetical protein